MTSNESLDDLLMDSGDDDRDQGQDMDNDEPVAKKRGRGRPRKADIASAIDQVKQDWDEESGDEAKKRGRGRPRKADVASPKDQVKQIKMLPKGDNTTKNTINGYGDYCEKFSTKASSQGTIMGVKLSKARGCIYVVKRGNGKVEEIESEAARKTCPDMVIDFYEQNSFFAKPQVQFTTSD